MRATPPPRQSRMSGSSSPGVDADRLTLWSLRDGAWEAETFEPTGASISALSWDADLGLLGVGSRDGRQAVWLFGKE